jgi:ligand-binding SRPBCC domain-containing protein
MLQHLGCPRRLKSRSLDGGDDQVGQNALVAPRTTTIERTTAIASPPEMVFAVVNSPETAARIDPAVRVWSPDRRPIGVGTQFSIRGRLGRLPIRGTSEVTVWDPPTCAEFRSVAPRYPFRMTAQHRFEARPDGGTDYTWTISFHEVSVIARPFMVVAARRFRPALESQAAALVAYLRDVQPGALPPEL